jgi:hypothetical protein
VKSMVQEVHISCSTDRTLADAEVRLPPSNAFTESYCFNPVKKAKTKPMLMLCHFKCTYIYTNNLNCNLKLKDVFPSLILLS